MRPIPKLFFFSLVVFLISFLPFDSLRSVQVLAGQPDSESSLKGFIGSQKNSTRERGVEPNPYSWHRRPFYNARGAPLSLSQNGPVGQGGQLLRAIIDDFLVNDDTTGGCEHSFPDVAGNRSGNFILTWEDSRYAGHDIYAQIYDPTGAPLGSNFKVNDDDGTAYKGRPVAAVDGSGNFIISWMDYRSGDWDIYAQRYNSEGTPIGSNFKVNDDDGTRNQAYPAVAVDGSGNISITWQDDRNEEYKSDIYAQRYTSSGIPVGANFMVNDDAGSNSQDLPAVAADGTGNFIITWEDGRNGPNIYAQRYNSAGIPLGANFMVNDTIGSSSNQGYPTIAVDGSGSFVITWMDQRNGYICDIYAQRFSSAGSPLGSNFKVNDAEERCFLGWPVIASDYAGNFTIAWEDYCHSGSDIYAQRFDASGTPLGSNFEVNDDPGDAYQWIPAIASDSSGNVVFTWVDSRNPNYNIYAQRYDPAGSPSGSNFKVNDDVGSALQEYPAMDVGDFGNAIITWQDTRDGDWNIYAQRCDLTGTPLGSNFRVNDDAGTPLQGYAAVAVDGSGNFVITWNDERNSSYYPDIYAQRYDFSGTPLGSNFKVNDASAYTLQSPRPAIVMDGSGNFVITWDDNRNSDRDIYAQIYDSSGTPLGSNFEVTDDAGTPVQRSPAIATDGSGNFVITWDDNRNNNHDIYAQRYDFSGAPLGSNFRVNDDPGTVKQSLPAIAMDGSGNFVITWHDERNGSDNPDIYVQRYNFSGAPLGSNFKVNDDGGAAVQGYPATAMDDSGSFVITWEDTRNGNYDIYAQRYDSSGIPLGTNYLVPNLEYASFVQVTPTVSACDTLIYFAWTDNRRAKTWDIYSKVVDWIWPSICGDVNADGLINVTDIVYLINYLFQGGPAPYPIQVADVNSDGAVNVIDVVYLINYLFGGGPPPSS